MGSGHDALERAPTPPEPFRYRGTSAQGGSPVVLWTRKRRVCLMNEAASSVVQMALRDRVLRMVHRKTRCDTNTVLRACAAYPWNEVFSEIDQLSLSGEFCLFYKADGEYAVRLPPAA